MKSFTFILAVISTLAIRASADEKPWTVRGHVPLEKIIIQSHRGAGVLAPENTLEAFELGWKMGTVPESDLRTTKDGVIVAFHDNNFKRTVKNPGALADKGVGDVTFARLMKLDVGGWKGDTFANRHVSKISDVFALMTGKPERGLYLDIKKVSLPQLASDVHANKVEKQIIFATTHYKLLTDWKKLVPESQTLLWMGGTEEQLKQRIDDLRKALFAGVTQLQLHVRLNTNSASAEPFTLSKKFIRETGEELRKHDILFQVLPWDVTDAKVYRQLLDLGVASFATDYPDVTLKAVRDYYARSK
jgi:glycerophosphoryl diester phosphodiesterase